MSENSNQDARISGAFVYFLAGSVAASGINFVTGVLTSSERELDSIALIFAGMVFLVISYQLTGLASVYEKYERLYIQMSPDALSNEEKTAVSKELNKKRIVETKGVRNPIVVLCALLVVFFIAREIVLGNSLTSTSVWSGQPNTVSTTTEKQKEGKMGK